MKPPARAPQRPRGTQDMIGEQAARFDHVVETFNRVRKLYGFGRVEVPVFEATSVFSRSLGETTDVVSKEMYSFEDRGGDSLTLRPEFTAGIARAYIENGWQQHAPMKLATWGPLFRYERPQKGRFRQFHQLDAEVIGAAEPAADVEVIALGQQVLDELGVAGDVVLQLNTMGDPDTRAAWSAATAAHFAANADALSEESRRRLAVNPLRILDSKEAADQPLVAGAPAIAAYMTAEAGAFFEALQKGLQASGIAWEANARLVRGLDYYRHTVFEFVTQALGSQGTVIGGGRYDGLIGAMGGPETPAVGWAGGIERLAMLTAFAANDAEVISIIPDGDGAMAKATALAAYLRREMPSVWMQHASFANRTLEIVVAFKTSQRKQFDRAKKRGSSLIIVVRADHETTDGSILVDLTQSDADIARHPHGVKQMVTALTIGSDWNEDLTASSGYRSDIRLTLHRR